MKMGGRSTGFTIVELLIVIVVIGILAVIALSTFSNAQRDARNAERLTSAQAWYKLLKTYTADDGAYPPGISMTGSGGHICLGEGLPADMDANVDEDCGESTNVKHPAAAMNTALKTPSPTLPSFPTTPLYNSAGTAFISGITLRTMTTVDSVANTPLLQYLLEGTNQDCKLRPLANGAYSSTTAARVTQSYSGSWGSSTVCRVILPLPSEL
ncbi:type II secretion system protein [Candidatus Saccharibacteria bacterium]|nr:type II secretion system protein [Candidatus Saccharibacteria bacterium]